MQRAYGNAAVARLAHTLQRLKADAAEENAHAEEEPVGAEEESDESAESSAAEPVSDAELLEDPEVREMFAEREPVEFRGETHTLYYELVDGELELGVATKWLHLRTITRRYARASARSTSRTRRTGTRSPSSAGGCEPTRQTSQLSRRRSTHS